MSALATENNTDAVQAWPGAFGVFDRSREVVRRNLSTFLALILLTFVLNLVISAVIPERGSTHPVTTVVSFLAGVWPATALVVAVLASLRKETISATDALKEASNFYVQFLGLTVLMGLITTLSVAALVVPFFFIYPRIVMAPYFLIDQKLGAVEALRASWEATRGHSGKVWGIVLVEVLFALLIFVIVGFYLLFMYMAAQGLLYLYLTRRGGQATDEAAAGEASEVVE